MMLRRLAVTQAISAAGDALVTIALARSLFFSISPHAARGKVTLYLALTLAPFAVMAPLLGPAIDRARGGRRLMMAAAAAGRAGACLLMARDLHRLLLFPEAFAMLVLSKTQAVAKSSLVPVVAGDAEFVTANAGLALAAVAGGLAAALPGALLVHFASGRWALRLAAAVFTAAAVAALGLPRASAPIPAPAGERPGAHRPPRAGGPEAASGSMAALRACLGFFTFLAAFELRRIGAPTWWYGVAIVTTTAGAAAGNLSGPRLGRALSERAMLLLSDGLAALAAAAAWWFGGRPLALLLGFSLGFAAATGKLAFDALVQRRIPPGERARRFARYETGFQLAWVLGALLPVALTVRPSVGFLAIAVGAGAALVDQLARQRERR